MSIFSFIIFIIYYLTVSFLIYENKKLKHDLSLLIMKNTNARKRKNTLEEIKMIEREYIDSLIWPIIIIKKFINVKKKK